MKSNTTVPVADYLELYEFKKAYDAGKKATVRDYEGNWYQIPVEDVSDRLEKCIRLFDERSKHQESLDEKTEEIKFMEGETNKLNQKLFNKEKTIDQLILEKVDIEKRLKSANTTSNLWKAASLILFASTILLLIYG